MSVIYTALTHILILITMAYLCYAIGTLIYTAKDRAQQILLSISVGVGFLIYMGAKGIGVSIPNLILQAVSTNRPLSYGLLGAAIPALAGFLTAWFVNSQVSKRSEIGMRWLIAFVIFMVAMFTELYVAASFSDEKPEGFNSLLAPNIIFTVTVGVYLMSKLRSEDLNKMIALIKRDD